MNILLISQCNKNALTESRRILDQFAERRGDRTWQTPITMEGVATLRKMLKKTARKNTAVACHWVRGKDHTELMWIVGDARRFSPEGVVPTNTTERNILRREDENDWHTAEDIKLLAALSALMHDLGKACDAFQARLRGEAEPGRNIYRHEWISLRLFQSFVGSDTDEGWLRRMAAPTEQDEQLWLARLEKDGLSAGDPHPFKHLPPLAAALGWLILTHHRLPVRPDKDGLRSEMLDKLPGTISAQWNQTGESADTGQVEPYWSFSGPLPVTVKKWQTQAAKYAEKLLQRMDREPRGWLQNTYVMHLSRLVLMLSDHHYSSLTSNNEWARGDANYPLYANTIRATGELCQKLDEHLLGVAKVSREVSYHITTLADNLPRLGRHKGFRRRSQVQRFRWQDRAFELTEAIREKADNNGFFGVNMASTGCGKTLANGRILYALADPKKGARFSVALGLRTLTLQTGQAYRERLNLSDDELAIRVGGSASRKLFEYYEQQAEKSGSASSQALMEEDDGHVYFEGGFGNHPVLEATAHNDQIKKLIAAPILVCTVDHLVPATEGARGGRQIAPMLRLMSSDLVLDEIDDFDLADLPALTRLVHWAGLLGSKVLLSSATLPPSLVLGLYEAYRAGRIEYQRNRGEPGAPLDLCCAWFDENDRTHQDCADGQAFEQAHLAFVQKRYQRLAKETIRRRGELLNLSRSTGSPEALRSGMAADLVAAASELHQQHFTKDPLSEKRISFGLIRMANIEPLVAVAREIYRLGAPEGQRIHLCVYHSQYPLLMRSAIEQQLDQALKRDQPLAVFDLPDVRRRLDLYPETDQLFIVLGSPVTEVGRDHDYDWAIVEPSSMRSLIQLAGRVRRHRQEACNVPNILLLNTNLRALEKKGEPAFCKPGFEGTGDWKLHTHKLEALLDPSEREVIDARPRILPHTTLQPSRNLVDLEHARLQQLMLQPESKPSSGRRRVSSAPKLGAYSWYIQPASTLTGVLQQWRPFRLDSRERVDLVLLPNEEEDEFILHKVFFDRAKRDDLYIPVDNLLHLIPLEYAANVTTWGDGNYMKTLEELAEGLDLSMDKCARRFGVLSLGESDNGWEFHPALGFVRKK